MKDVGLRPIPERLETVGLVLLTALLLPGLIVLGVSHLESANTFLQFVAQAVKFLAIPIIFVGLPIFRMKALNLPVRALGLGTGSFMASLTSGAMFGVGVFFSNAVFTQTSTIIIGWLIGIEAAFELVQAEQSRVASLLSHDTPLLTVASIVILLVVITPIAEELFFRGYMYSALRYHLSAGWAMVASAALFSIFHFYIVQLLPIFIAGLIFAWLYERGASLLASIIAHATVNGIVVSLLLFQLS